MPRHGSVDCTLCFAELDKCSDAMMLGFTTLQKLGFHVRDDDNGNSWVKFTKLGINMLGADYERA